MKKVVWIVLAACVLGCSGGDGKKSSKVEPSEPVKKLNFQPGDEKKLLPATIGNQWVYQQEGALLTVQGRTVRQGDLTVKIGNVNVQPDGTRVQVQLMVNEEPADNQVWLINDTGIYTLSSSKAAFTPPQHVIPFPVEAGKTFSWSGTGTSAVSDKPTKGEMTGKILGIQEVDTEMGPMEAMAVETRNKVTQGANEVTVDTTIWWVPNVGFVRYRQDIRSPQMQQTVVLKLKSYTVK